jgi:hypothetical protein
LKRDGLSAKPGPNDEAPECFTKLKADPEITAFFGDSVKASSN